MLVNREAEEKAGVNILSADSTKEQPIKTGPQTRPKAKTDHYCGI